VKSLVEWSLADPQRILYISAVVTIAAVPGLFRLQVRTDSQAMIPKSEPAVEMDRRIRQHFDIEDKIILVIETEHRDGIFNTETLTRLAELTAQLPKVDGVEAHNIIGLATEKSGRHSSGPVRFPTFLDPVPATPAAIAGMRRDIYEMRVFTGTLISLDGGLPGGRPDTPAAHSESGTPDNAGPDAAASDPTADWRPTATAILVGVDNDIDRAKVYRAIKRLALEYESKTDRIHIVGAPVAESLLGEHLLIDLSRLVPICMGLIALIFLFVYRSWVAAALPLIEVGASIVIIFGLMGYAGVPVYLPIILIPVILTSVGVADEVHIFSRYVQRLGSEMNKPHGETVYETLSELRQPVVLTSVTSAIAFLSFVASPIAAVRAFGLFTALGILILMFWSLTVIPAQLLLIKPSRFRRQRPQFARASRFGIAALTRGLLAGRWWIVGTAILLVGLSPLGLSRIHVQDSWTGAFSHRSTFRRSTALGDDRFHGTHMLLIGFDTSPGFITNAKVQADTEPAHPYGAWQMPERYTVELSDAEGYQRNLTGSRVVLHARPIEPDSVTEDDENPVRYADPYVQLFTARVVKAESIGDRLVLRLERPREESDEHLLSRRPYYWVFSISVARLLDPVMMKHLQEFESFLRRQVPSEMGGVLGAHDQIATAKFVMRSRREAERGTGENPAVNRFILKLFRGIRGQARLQEVVDDERQQAIVTVYLKGANFVRTRQLMEAIRDYERSVLEPLGVRLDFAGDVAVSQTMIAAIVDTQVRSLLLSLVLVFLITAFAGRSIWWGILCVLPAGLAVLMNFVIMNFLNIPLGVATSMFPCITVGIGVDFVIHLLQRCRVRFNEIGNVHEMILDAMTSTGPAIALSAFVIIIGFAVMLVSEIPANHRLGIIVASSIGTSCLVTMVLLPALVKLWPPRTLNLH